MKYLDRLAWQVMLQVDRLIMQDYVIGMDVAHGLDHTGFHPERRIDWELPCLTMGGVFPDCPEQSNCESCNAKRLTAMLEKIEAHQKREKSSPGANFNHH